MENNLKWETNDWADDSNFSVDKKIMNSRVEEIEDKVLKLYKEKTLKVIKKIEEIGMPKKNEQFRLITMRSFNSINFLEFITEKYKVKDVYMCVYSINDVSANIIDKLANNGIKFTIVISSLRNGSYNRKERIVNAIFIKNPNITLIFAVSHAKILTLKADNSFFTIEGSGNLSANSRIEQYILDNDKKVYDFHKQWINEIDKHITGKSLIIHKRKNS